MKFFHNLLKAKRRYTVSDSRSTPKNVEPKIVQEAEGGYSDELSFGWFGDAHVDSSIFDSASGPAKQTEIEDTASLRKLNRESDTLCDVEENMGFDPYNTGRFVNKKI